VAALGEEPATVIILARLLGTAAKLLGQPPVLGEILAGILLGPTFFAHRDVKPGNVLLYPGGARPATALQLAERIEELAPAPAPD
jgi:hypothetical protein